MLTDKFSQENMREYEDGECIFREGDRSFEMYVVQSGSVVVTKGELPLAVLGRGDFLGEMSLLESLPRSATAVAKGKARLLCIQPGGFLLKIRRDPTFAFELMQSLSHRIRVTNEKLLESVSEGQVDEASLHLILDKGAA
jgi:CRP/FNR family transcriptional regulator, cyclic AMP receptor protein